MKKSSLTEEEFFTLQTAKITDEIYLHFCKLIIPREYIPRVAVMLRDINDGVRIITIIDNPPGSKFRVRHNIEKINGHNQEISKEEAAKIRQLEDFDLTMLISEIHDFGWPAGRNLLPMIPLGGRDRKAATDPSS